MKKLKIIFYILVGAGWFLNAKYYISRFMSEGFDERFAWLVSITLVIFASITFGMSNYYKETNDKFKRRITLYAWCVMAIFSINCTLAGQYFDQQMRKAADKQKINDQSNEIVLSDLYMKRINELQNEYDSLEEQKNKTIESLEDRYYWKFTTEALETRQDKIRKEIKEYESKIESIAQNDKISIDKKEITEVKNIFEFYNKKDPELLQFFSQLILSILIELIAPFSVMFLMSFRVEKKQQEKKMCFDSDTLRHFALLAWFPINKKNQDNILSKKEMLLYAEKKGINLTEPVINEILNESVKRNLLKKISGKYYPYNSFVDMEYFQQELQKET